MVFRDEGSVWLFRPDAEAKDWVEENVSDPIWFAGSMTVDASKVECFIFHFSESGGTIVPEYKPNS
jgi:hypothetical protein